MISENLARIRQRIAEAAKRAGRDPEDITLICVTKSAALPQLQQAISSGVRDIGENRVTDALLKYSQIETKGVRWHLIGHLQTNKVKKALDVFDTIHSLESLKLAEEIDKRAGTIGKRIDCLIEVNTSGEPSKYGIETEEAESFLKKAALLPNIHIIGLMTMAPFVDDAQLVRPCFLKLRRLRDDLKSAQIPNTDIEELSMGMTQDFEVAIEEGATFVRIGTAIFSG